MSAGAVATTRRLQHGHWGTSNNSAFHLRTNQIVFALITDVIAEGSRWDNPASST
jgi:hypothetical protein